MHREKYPGYVNNLFIYHFSSVDVNQTGSSARIKTIFRFYKHEIRFHLAFKMQISRNFHEKSDYIKDHLEGGRLATHEISDNSYAITCKFQ